MRNTSQCCCGSTPDEVSLAFTQFLDQQRVSTVQARSNGSHRAAKGTGSFFVAQFLKIAQSHNFPVVQWKSQNRLSQALTAPPAESGLPVGPRVQ